MRDVSHENCKPIKTMKPLSSIAGIFLLAISILVAKDSSPQSGTDGEGKRVSSDPTHTFPITNQPKFEYKVQQMPQFNSEQESELNQLGRGGWELVVIQTQVNNSAKTGMNSTAFLKRILREPRSDEKQLKTDEEQTAPSDGGKPANLVRTNDTEREIYSSTSFTTRIRKVFSASESFLSTRPATLTFNQSELEQIIQQFVSKSDSRIAAVRIMHSERIENSCGGVPFEVVVFVTVDANNLIQNSNDILVIFGDKTILSPKQELMSSDEIDALKKKLRIP